MKRISRLCGTLLIAIAAVWACGFDDSLREYLSARFWLPFAKRPSDFERRNVRRISAPFAGMDAAGNGSLAKLRAAYQNIAQPESGFNADAMRRAVAAARADPTLSAKEREEVDLIDAKVDLRSSGPGGDANLDRTRTKLELFLKTARTPEFRSEARGWLARVYYLSGNQTAAGKIYLDELNRNGSNLSRETLLNSLRMTYGYDGGVRLVQDLEQYFDTPEHAAFAIQLLTNPHWNREARQFQASSDGPTYARVKALLESHENLLRSKSGANELALLAMRTALRMGDPPAALTIAEAIPANAALRTEPDFTWMLASAHFLSHDFAGAEQPLLALFRSSHSSADQKAAAAYGLCGVYSKTGNAVEQIRFALWLHNAVRRDIDDVSVYWAVSGWDLNMLLEVQAPTEALQAFVTQNPDVPDVRLVKYSLAVRLTREERYEEAAEIYQEIRAVRRAPRLRRLAALYKEAHRAELSDRQRQENAYGLAEFISANGNGIYFNDALWGGLQRYAFQAETDNRLTAAERQALIDGERELKDTQEERWRAYLILKEVIRNSGATELSRKAAILAIRCLRGINERFGRLEEIRRAEIDLSKLLR